MMLLAATDVRLLHASNTSKFAKYSMVLVVIAFNIGVARGEVVHHLLYRILPVPLPSPGHGCLWWLVAGWQQ
jgi:hypothetical protein